VWDDYMGWDWYAVRQYTLFAFIITGLISVIGITEGYPWHHPVTVVGNILIANSTTALIVSIILLVAGFRFVMFKEGY
jgi:hypothetical protein